MRCVQCCFTATVTVSTARDPGQLLSTFSQFLSSEICWKAFDVFILEKCTYIDFRSCFRCCVFFRQKECSCCTKLRVLLELVEFRLFFFFLPTKENKSFSLQCWLFVDRCDLWALTLAQWLSATWTSSQTSWICPSVGTGRSVLVSVYLLVFFYIFYCGCLVAAITVTSLVNS